MDISNLYAEIAADGTTDAATTAQQGTGLLWMPIALAEVKEGMTLRLEGERYTGATVVSTVRMEIFSETDEALVVDAIYPSARVRDVFSNFREVSYLRLAH